MIKRKFTSVLHLLLSVIFVSAGSIAPVSAKSVDIMTKEELKKELGNADLVILDVRSGKDWTSSEFKIQGAVRKNPSEFASWGSTFDKDKKLVLYCA
jgi:rhodanese-related sulfurtransferase